MKFTRHFVSLVLLPLALVGCVSDGLEHGRDGTVAYHVEIESSEPGARVEANDEYVGVTPMTLTIFGDKDGTFHNFGSSLYIINAYPVRGGQYLQRKVFSTGGGWFAGQDMIPKKIYFDMNLVSERPAERIQLDINNR